MERVLILGCAGAGKSTLAARLAELTGLPLINLDRHYWRPGWTEPGRETWEQQVRELIAQPFWIIDGNYTSTLELRLMTADTAIFLDLPTWVCLAGIARRNFTGRRVDVIPGCTERIDWGFIGYVLSFRRKHRPRMVAMLERFSGHLRRFTGRAEMADYLDEISPPQNRPVVA